MSKRTAPEPERASKHRRLSSTSSRGTTKRSSELEAVEVTDANSTSVLQLYIGSLRNDLTLHNAKYSFAFGSRGPNDPECCCTIDLPFNAGVRTAEGKGRNKQVAKRGAARAAVLALIAAGEIGLDLRPTPANPTAKGQAAAQKKVATSVSVPTVTKATTAPKATTTPKEPMESKDANAAAPGPKIVVSGRRTTAARHPATASAIRPDGTLYGEDAYPVLAYPEFWAASPDGPAPLSKKLYASIISLSLPAPYKAADCRVLCLLTCRRLPLPALELDISAAELGPNPSPSVRAGARLVPAGKMKLDTEQLDVLFEFSRMFLRAVTNRPLDGTLENTSYLVAPLRADFPRDDSVSKGVVSKSDIDWDQVNAVEHPAPQRFNIDHIAEQVVDAVITPPAELTRRFYITGLRTDLTPASPSPCNPSKTVFEQIAAENRYEHANMRTDRVKDFDQPLIESQHLLAASRGGITASLAKGPANTVLHIPELMCRHFISASVFRTGTMVPSILQTLDDELLAHELNQRLFDGRLERGLVLEAISSPGSCTRAGQPNYERLETFGDTLLKLATTVDIYLAGGGRTEGEMTRERQVTVSNKSLRTGALDAGFIPYIRKTVRKASSFLPPGWVADGDAKPATYLPATTQTVGDKVIADIVEALIAAAYLSGDDTEEVHRFDAAVDAMRALCIPLPLLKKWSDLKAELGPEGKPLTVLGYTFRNGGRGRVALSAAADDERKKQFERYEFLGDAVIDYLTMEALWKENPDLGPAQLTIMKHSRVANSAFAAFMAYSGLADLLTDLDEYYVQKLDTFKAEIGRLKKRADANIAKGNPDREFWAKVPEEKWLGDTLEALFGAIIVDSDFDLAPARALFTAHLLPFLTPYGAPANKHSWHPKSALLQLLARSRCAMWKLTKDGEPPAPCESTVIVHDKEIARASDKTTRLAQREACAIALAALQDGKLAELCSCAAQRQNGTL